MLLSAGHSVERIAKQRHVALSTVRSQLRMLLMKTGSERQSDLVRRLLSSPDGLGDNGDGRVAHASLQRSVKPTGSMPSPCRPPTRPGRRCAATECLRHARPRRPARPREAAVHPSASCCCSSAQPPRPEPAQRTAAGSRSCCGARVIRARQNRSTSACRCGWRPTLTGRPASGPPLSRSPPAGMGFPSNSYFRLCPGSSGSSTDARTVCPLRRRAAQPTIASPASSSPQASGSGTAATCNVTVPRP